MRRSSEEMYVSPSELREIELIWYAWAFANTFLGDAVTTVSRVASCGKVMPLLVFVGPVTCFSFFSKTFHNLIVLSVIG
jgi:hypothetical protein